MSLYTKRVQTVLTEEQFELLSQVAEQEQKPLSVMIREAVEQVYFEEVARKRRRKALERLLKLNAPIDDWPVMEAKIEKGAIE
jgi:hypothetical protein